MSYCRWSSGDWNCDLYCYEDARGGWTTHVAENRYKYPLKANTEFRHLEKNLVKIDLPHAGETFNDPTLKAFRQRLVTLREIGYIFPDGVFQEVDEEIELEKARKRERRHR